MAHRLSFLCFILYSVYLSYHLFIFCLISYVFGFLCLKSLSLYICKPFDIFAFLCFHCEHWISLLGREVELELDGRAPYFKQCDVWWMNFACTRFYGQVPTHQILSSLDVQLSKSLQHFFAKFMEIRPFTYILTSDPTLTNQEHYFIYYCISSSLSCGFVTLFLTYW